MTPLANGLHVRYSNLIFIQFNILNVCVTFSFHCPMYQGDAFHAPSGWVEGTGLWIGVPEVPFTIRQAVYIEIARNSGVSVFCAAGYRKCKSSLSLFLQ